jgi:triosephosphate isomerase (TIM)
MKILIVVNFKTYKQGKAVVKLAREIERVSKNIIIGVQAGDVYEVARAVKLKVFAEHVDYYKPGRHTGYIIPESVKRDGGKGVFLNHSEHRLNLNVIKKTVKRCKQVGLKTAVFAKDLREAKEVERLKPDYLIIEPPELVAGKRSVSKENPNLIKNLSKNLKMNFLVGAGIKTKEDVKIALRLGAVGIAVSSGIVKSINPYKKLKEMTNVK